MEQNIETCRKEAHVNVLYRNKSTSRSSCIYSVLIRFELSDLPISLIFFFAYLTYFSYKIINIFRYNTYAI